VKKVLLLLSVTAVLVLLFAPVALADHHTAMSTATSSATSSASATASATATATALPRSGGTPLVLPVTLAASLALVASGIGALALLRRGVS
jgi:hypothetical protein